MDCQTTQEQILASLAEPQAGANTPDLEIHLAGCEVCRSFSETHFILDLQLSAAISPPSLSPAFRMFVAKSVRSEQLSVRPEFLPGVAHIAGCLCATGVCVLLLPFASGPVMLAGLAFTVVTYFAQAELQGSLDVWEQD